jgi:hypothetical protein
LKATSSKIMREVSIKQAALRAAVRSDRQTKGRGVW